MRVRALARIIAESDGGCYVVFPTWSIHLAIRMDTLPPTYAGQLPHRTHAMVDLDVTDPEDLEPEWCPAPGTAPRP